MQIFVKGFNNKTFVVNISDIESITLLDLKKLISARYNKIPVEQFQIYKNCSYIESKFKPSEKIRNIGFQNDSNIEIRPIWLN